MKTKKLTCDHCGAVLTIDGAPKFVDCRFCGTSLRIVRTESAIFTQVREAVDKIGAEVSGLRKESKLRKLEEDWRKQQDTFRLGPHQVVPRRQDAQSLAVLLGITCILLIIIALRFMQSTAAFVAGFVPAVIVGLFGFFYISWLNRRVKRYEDAERKYLAKRRVIEEGPTKSAKSSRAKAKARSK